MMQYNRSNLKPISFKTIIEALLEDNTPFNPRYLNRLSGLESHDIALLREAWPKVSLRRREALLEDLEEIHIADDLLNFEAVARLALKDKVASVRTRAIRILREYELVDLLPTFQEMAEADPDDDVRAGATAALSTYIYLGEVEDISPAKLKQVEECLLRLVSSPQPTLVRRRALEALGFSSRQEVNGLIDQAYASDDVDWVITALFAMGRSANSHWIPQVMKMITHQHPGVRAEAAGAAGELEIKSARKNLLDLLGDDDLDVRMAAIWSLSQIGGKGVRKALEHLLKTTDNDEEAEQIESALENLDFTEEMQNLDIFNLSDNGYESPDDKLQDDEESNIDEDDED
jgi:HEAT repeat protein